MSNERNTHFSDFAEALFSQLREMGLTALVDIRNFPDNPDRADELQNEMDQLTREIIAHRSYDLVEHVLREMNPTPYVYDDTPEQIIRTIPDMLKLPQAD